MSDIQPGDPVGAGTAGHLPECGWWEDLNERDKNEWRRRGCICERLRTYGEKRYAAALAAARHAVAVRLTQMGYDTEDTNPYLAAIDELLWGDDE